MRYPVLFFLGVNRRAEPEEIKRMRSFRPKWLLLLALREGDGGRDSSLILPINAFTVVLVEVVVVVAGAPMATVGLPMSNGEYGEKRRSVRRL